MTKMGDKVSPKQSCTATTKKYQMSRLVSPNNVTPFGCCVLNVTMDQPVSTLALKMGYCCILNLLRVEVDCLV
jgi:hypothetical protein